jgi:hypothetical protein
MPSGRINQTFYTGAAGSPELLNVSTLYKPGELGSQCQVAGKAYQLVQVDSGATSATTAGALATGQLAFWKDRSSYLVTNDKIQAEGGGTTQATNSVAGVFCATTAGGVAGSATATAGNFTFIQQRGNHVGILSTGSTAAAGDLFVAGAGVATPAALRVAAGTALVSQQVARATAATGAVTASYTPAFIGGSDLVDVA